VGIVGRLAHGYMARRHAVLFYTLLATLAAGPLLTALHFSSDLLQIFVAFNVLVALSGVTAAGRRLRLLLLAAVVIGLRVAPVSMVGERVAMGALVVGSGIALLAVVVTARFALRSVTIDNEHVYAALSAYVLAGLLFAALHMIVAITWPGSYMDAGAPALLTLPSAIYFSFVTLATLGYGDVIPRSEVARGLAIFEAVAGQLYIAVTIARLVSAQRIR
jgi:hypothetical protein